MSNAETYRAFTTVIPHFASSTTCNTLEYTGWMDEQFSWKKTRYMGTWRFVPQIRIEDPDALGLFKELSTARTGTRVGRPRNGADQSAHHRGAGAVQAGQPQG